MITPAQLDKWRWDRAKAYADGFVSGSLLPQEWWQLAIEEYRRLVVDEVCPSDYHDGPALSHERAFNHFAKALQEFGRVSVDQPVPNNAITLWRAIVDGLHRVADRLSAPPEK